MAGELINKVVYGGRTLIDLTPDDVTRADVQSGKIFHLSDGSSTTGTNTWDADTRDATATAAEILKDKTAYKNGAKITGTMPNIGKQTASISTLNDSVTISKGYHDGSGSVTIDATEKAKLISSNIKNGVVILGVTGTLTGDEMVNATTATVTPSTTTQVILPTDKGDYGYFTQVTVNAIPYSEVVNEQGGLTVTIG